MIVENAEERTSLIRENVFNVLFQNIKETLKEYQVPDVTFVQHARFGSLKWKNFRESWGTFFITAARFFHVLQDRRVQNGKVRNIVDSG